MLIIETHCVFYDVENRSVDIIQVKSGPQRICKPEYICSLCCHNEYTEGRACKMFVRTRRMSSERFGYFEKLTSTKIINTRGYFPLNKNKNNYNALSFKSHHRHVKRFKSSTSRHRPAVSAATHVLSEQFLTCSRNKLPLAAICLSPIDKLSA